MLNSDPQPNPNASADQEVERSPGAAQQAQMQWVVHSELTHHD